MTQPPAASAASPPTSPGSPHCLRPARTYPNLPRRIRPCQRFQSDRRRGPPSATRMARVLRATSEGSGARTKAQELRRRPERPRRGYLGSDLSPPQEASRLRITAISEVVPAARKATDPTGVHQRLAGPPHAPVSPCSLGAGTQPPPPARAFPEGRLMFSEGSVGGPGVMCRIPRTDRCTEKCSPAISVLSLRTRWPASSTVYTYIYGPARRGHEGDESLSPGGAR